MKFSCPHLKIIFLAVLLAVPNIVAKPAYSFWFFKHKQSSQNEVSPNLNYQNNFANSYQVNQSPDMPGTRLVPSYLNTPSRQRNKVNKEQIKNFTIQPINNSFFEHKPISNIIPIDSSSTYSKTNLKVAIGLNVQSVKLAIIDGAQLIDNSTGDVVANLPAQSQWILSIRNGDLTLSPNRDFYLALKELSNSFMLDSRVKEASYRSAAPVYAAGSAKNISKSRDFTAISEQQTKTNSLSLPFNSLGYTIKTSINQQSQQSLLALNNNLYRGDFLIKLNSIQSKNADTYFDRINSSFNVINCLDLEDYLLSVVPSEMPSLWPLEALKAQAIAARSYALANLGKHDSAGYDLKDNTEDQMYVGVKSESDLTNQAVNGTKGLVMKYDGKPICAYFHSCSGGSTELAENVWHSPVPYLKAVIDFDQEAPLYNWTKNYSVLQTETGLPKDIGQVFSLTILAKGPSGRATYILINSSRGSRIISGEAARKYFNLPSSNFNVTATNSAYIFSGKGFGHGLGLSQWGAKSLAKNGYNAAQILCYYYDGISISY